MSYSVLPVQPLIYQYLGLGVRKFPEIYSNLSGNFRKFVKYFFHFIIFNYNHIKKFENKHIFDKQLSRSLCFNFMHLVQAK